MTGRMGLAFCCEASPISHRTALDDLCRQEGGSISRAPEFSGSATTTPDPSAPGKISYKDFTKASCSSQVFRLPCRL